MKNLILPLTAFLFLSTFSAPSANKYASAPHVGDECTQVCEHGKTSAFSETNASYATSRSEDSFTAFKNKDAGGNVAGAMVADNGYYNITSVSELSSDDITAITIIGDSALMGSDWNPTDTANDMISFSGGRYRYKLVKENVVLSAGDYQYKLVTNHVFGNKELPAYGNQILSIDSNGTYTITFKCDGNITELIADYAKAVPSPVMDPASGYATSVSISASEGTIYYRTDGANPNGSSTRYTGPIAVTSDNFVIKAVAISGGTMSAVTSGTFSNVKPAAANTISNILGTVAGGFPRTFEKGWSSSNDYRWYIDQNNFTRADKNGQASPRPKLELDTQLTKSGDDYVYSTSPAFTLTFVMNSGVLQSITFAHKMSQFEKYNGTYIAVTIADLLATVVGGFPTSDGDAPANAWVSDNGHTLYFHESDKQLYCDTLDAAVVGTKTTLTKSGDSYFYTNVTSTITFNMKGGVLASITLTGTGDYSGTYAAPVTVADLLATVAGGFPTTFETGWVNSSNGYKCFINPDHEYQLEMRDVVDSQSYIVLTQNTVLTKSGDNFTISKITSISTFVMDNGVLQSIIYEPSDHPAARTHAHYAGTYAAPVTIADLLATVAGGFPTSSDGTPPSNAWINSNKTTMFSFGSGFYITSESDGDLPLSADTVLVKDGNNYKCTKDGATVTFVMNGGALTSVEVQNCEVSAKLDGTYTAPAATTPIEIAIDKLGTVQDFPFNAFYAFELIDNETNFSFRFLINYSGSFEFGKTYTFEDMDETNSNLHLVGEVGTYAKYSACDFVATLDNDVITSIEANVTLTTGVVYHITYTAPTYTYEVSFPEGPEQVYIAGDTSDWSFVEMTMTSATTATITVYTQFTEYKYTAGAAWEYVEKDAGGGEIANRTAYANPDVVESWAAVPSPAPAEIDCPDCNGTGHSEECRCNGTGSCCDCDGTGKCYMCGYTGICPRCHGIDSESCFICGGTGKCEICGGNNTCDRCHGSGKCTYSDHLCTTCGGTGKVAAPAHTHNLVKVAGQAATETAAGFKDYYECKDSEDACHKYFEDSNGLTPIEDLAAWKTGKGALPKLIHTINPVSGKAATQTESGYKAYYECPNCGKYYEDAEGLIEIPDIDAWKSKGGDGYLPSGEEIAAAKVAAKAALDEENAKDPLTDTAALTNGKIAIDEATTLKEIEAAKNNALAEIREAQRIELEAAKSAAKPVLDAENAKEPLTDTAALTNGKAAIDAATTKAGVESAKSEALAAIRAAQASELQAAKNAAKSALDAENANDPLTDTTALIEGKAAIDAATTKAGVESAKAEALAAIRAAQASELEAAKSAAKSALDGENAKDPLIDETSLTNGKAAIDAATTKAGVESAKAEALAAIRAAQASELEAAKSAAKSALDAENANDPLANTSSLTNGKSAIDAATTKAGVESAEAEALAAIREAQRIELEAAKSAAKPVLDAENAKDPLVDETALIEGKAAIDAATTKAGVEAAKSEALAAIRAAQASELQAAKTAAKSALDAENAKDPLANTSSLTNGKAAIDAATTKAGVESAKSDALAAIRAAQASELQAAKTAAKSALDGENANEPLVDETSLANGKAAIDSATTKAGVESAKSEALAAIRAAQADELQAAKTAAKAALDEEEAKRPLGDKSSLTDGKASVDRAATKAQVQTAKNSALTAIRDAQARELRVLIWTIVIISLVVLCGAGVALFFLIRKKKKAAVR